MDARGRVRKVGLTGLNAAGKGEAARILGEYGYAYFSLSDIVREEAARRGIEQTRENLIRVGNDLRRRHGPGVLAEMIRERLAPYSVIDSIRNPEEVRVLRRLDGFLLVAVHADPETRFRRMMARGRLGDVRDFDEFLRLEEREKSGSAYEQQLHVCIGMADASVDNNGTVEELEAQVLAVCGLTGTRS